MGKHKLQCAGSSSRKAITSANLRIINTNFKTLLAQREAGTDSNIEQTIRFPKCKASKAAESIIHITEVTVSYASLHFTKKPVQSKLCNCYSFKYVTRFGTGQTQSQGLEKINQQEPTLNCRHGGQKTWNRHEQLNEIQINYGNKAVITAQ